MTIIIKKAAVSPAAKEKAGQMNAELMQTAMITPRNFSGKISFFRGR
jgi:hypothetical protein